MVPFSIDINKACMAFTKASGSTGICFMMHSSVVHTIALAGDDPLKKSIFEDILNNHSFTAFAVSEHGGGVNINQNSAAIEEKEDYFIINGKKSMVTSGGYADYYLSSTQSIDPEELDLFVVAKDAAGVSFESDKWKGVGMRGNVSAPMVFDQVKVTAAERLGDQGHGTAIVQELLLPYFMLGLASVYSGITQAVLESAIDHATSRTYPEMGLD